MMDYLDKLELDIKKHNDIYNNPDKFIKSRNLVQHPVMRFVEEELPANFYMGKYYLIRNKGIIEISNSIVFKTTDLLFSNVGENKWECVVTFHNVTSEELNGMDISDDIISYNTEHTTKFILALIKSGFKLYRTQ